MLPKLPSVNERTLRWPYVLWSAVLLGAAMFPSAVGAAEHTTDHFSIAYFGDQNAAYARVTGSYLERAFSLYKDTLRFDREGRSSTTGKYEVELLSTLLGAHGMCLKKLTQSPGESFIRAAYGLGMGDMQELHLTCFHEYYHAVTTRYLPYAWVGVAMKPAAKKQAWCIEGQARFIEYWATGFPNGIANIGPTQEDAAWIREPKKSLRTVGQGLLAYPTGYSAFVFWDFIVANTQIDFDANGQAGDNIAVLRRFWEELAKESDWEDGPSQTAKAMNAALAPAPAPYNTFAGCFTEFTRSLCFPQRFYDANDQTRGWIQANLPITQIRLSETAPSYLTSTAVEEMGAECFRIADVPANYDVEISAEVAQDAGFVVSTFPGGQYERLHTLAGGERQQVDAANARQTVILLTRLPGSSGTQPCTLKVVARPAGSQPGMLDLVLCIDKSGSMVDDIKAVQEGCDATLEALDQYAKTNKIELRVGLVTYTRHDEANWIQGNPLTADVATIRRYIQGISITNLALGKGGNEDMYGALMYAMNEPVGGQKMAMGWRPGAAKIVFPIGDEPPDDPDWDERTLDDVARVAKNLDPVHMYPLLTPKQGSTFLDPAARAMERIANATGGQVFRVASAGDLPETVVAAVKLAVRQHRNEVWRKHNQPYVLYGAIAAVLGLMVLTTVGLILRAALSRPKRPTP